MPRTQKSKNKPPLDKFMQKVVAKNKGMKYVVNPEGEISLSDAISKIIEPYRKDAPDAKAFRNLVAFACIAWNASLFPVEKRDEMMEEMLTKIPLKGEDRAQALGLLNALMKRKQKLFPQVTRMIIEYKVTDLGNDFHIAVASTLEK